jgi:hypothetical protein
MRVSTLVRLKSSKMRKSRTGWLLLVFRKSNGRAPWISTFDPETWDSPGFSDRVIELLARTFADGAVGVKIYKSIGMELKSRKTGKYLMPDDQVFDPILEYIAERGKTLYAHIAEPDYEWVPWDPNSLAFKEDDQFWNATPRPTPDAQSANRSKNEPDETGGTAHVHR